MYLICFLFLIIILILLKVDMRKIHLYFKNIILFNLIGIKAVIEDKKYTSSNIKLKYQRNGDIAVVTGGSRGIGFEIVKSFLEMNMTVIIGCRNLLTAERAIKSIRELGIIGGNADCIHLDTSTLKSVRKFADTIKTRYEHIHILVNNAGILFCPFNLTEDGYEYTFSTNYLGHSLLTHLLLPSLIKGRETRNMNSRVINVSSIIYEIASINLQNINLIDNYSPDIAYAQSKLAQLLFTITLNEKLKYINAPVQVHAVHPGVVNSNLFEKTWLKSSWLTKLIFKSPEEGARSIIFASLHDTLENKAGNYISNCQVFETTKVAKNKIVQESLWNLTLELLKIQNFGNVL